MTKDLTYIPKYVRERERESIEHLFVSSKGGGALFNYCFTNTERGQGLTCPRWQV